jgi:adenylate kinase family enzyme
MTGERQTIEIVGVAGSGKSTLTRALRSGYGCHVADSLHTRMPAHWQYVAHALPGLVPLVAASARDRPLLSWDELKFVVYVAEWHRFLRAERLRHSEAIVLDQGPIFALACLEWGQKPFTRSARFEEWQRRMVERWSLELDTIVLLDAPDETLLARIDDREQGHDAKGAPLHEGLALLERHRSAYGRVLELTERLGGPRLLRYDTATMPPAEIAAELAKVVDLSRAQELTETPGALNVIRGRTSTRGDA